VQHVRATVRRALDGPERVRVAPRRRADGRDPRRVASVDRVELFADAAVLLGGLRGRLGGGAELRRERRRERVPLLRDERDAVRDAAEPAREDPFESRDAAVVAASGRADVVC